jgi:hypothetical protein
MYRLWISLALASTASPATLEKLTLDQMTAQATEIVRAKVGVCAAGYRGRLIYTTCSLDVTERWKGATGPAVRVSLPGGVVGQVRQSFAGTPVLTPGREHVFFLWTGPSGLTQLIGLSQGLLGLERLPTGEWMAVRAPVAERMLDRAGNPVRDEGIDMPLDVLRKRVAGGTDK